MNYTDASRIERGQLDAEHMAFLREVNAPPSDMCQLEATRGPDCIDDDVSFMMRVAGVIVGGLVFAIFLYAWIAGPVEVTL